MYAVGGFDVAPLPLAEFLQRVFVGVYALSIKDHDEYMLQESLVESLIEMSKAQIALEAKRLGVPFALTWTCYDPQIHNGAYTPCEQCDACILRRNGFAEAGLSLSNEEIFGSPIALAQTGSPETPSR